MEKLILKDDTKKQYEDMLHSILEKKIVFFIDNFIIFLMWEHLPDVKKCGLTREEFRDKKVIKLALEISSFNSQLENVKKGFVLV